MNPAQKRHVAVIGAGVAGLTAAEVLADWGVQVSLLEKSPFVGGHAVQLNCKATDACVKCGACMVADKLQRVVGHAGTSILAGVRVDEVSGQQPYRLRYTEPTPVVDIDRCDGCGICLHECPVAGAIATGRSPRGGSRVAIMKDRCLYFDAASCTRCQEICPQGAIDLSAAERSGVVEVDAVVVATGFLPFDPRDKPYGHGRFANVVSSLEAERLLRDASPLKRPSDGKPARRIAFIQCVGSRDAQLGHLWCSKICCGSSMRMARLLQARQAEAEITFFYIDLQTFGRDFDAFYRQARQRMTLIRAIPGEIHSTAAGDPEVVYFDPHAGKSTEATFDLVVLSVGLLPAADNRHVGQIFKLPLDRTGFMPAHQRAGQTMPAGLFTAGAATGPMSIAESIGSAEKAAYDVIRYLGAPIQAHPIH